MGAKTRPPVKNADKKPCDVCLSYTATTWWCCTDKKERAAPLALRRRGYQLEEGTAHVSTTSSTIQKIPSAPRCWSTQVCIRVCDCGPLFLFGGGARKNMRKARFSEMFLREGFADVRPMFRLARFTPICERGEVFISRMQAMQQCKLLDVQKTRISVEKELDFHLHILKLRQLLILLA